ncbi:MAG TPA: hypothetical protein VGQ15_06760 [Gaiellaceae bacterium]|nr:hypothetical protein [Gaiellaceae bacterium]
MSLLDTLTGGFSQGGFDLDDAAGGLRSVLDGVDPPSANLDGSALGGIAERLGQADLGSIGGAVESIAGLAQEAGAGLPDVAELIRPLEGVLDAARTLTSSDTLQILQTLEQAGTSAPGGVGLGSLAAPLRALDEARSGPVGETLRTLTGIVPADLDLQKPIDLLGGTASGVVSLVRLLGGLMATDTLTRELASSSALIAGMIRTDAVDAAIARLDAWSPNTTLAPLVTSADPDDPQVVEIVAAPVLEVVEAIRGAADALVGGMAYGEATLAHAGLPRLTDELALASALLSESALPPVRQLVLDLRAKLEPLLAVDLGAPADSFDAFLGEITGLTGELGAAIDRIDPAAIAAPLTNVLGDVLHVLDQIEHVAEEVRTAFQSAFQTIHQAISAIDLRPVAETIRSALQPAVDALAQVQALVGEAQQTIEDTSQAVIDAMNEVKSSLGDAATTVHDAYQRVAGTIEGLHLDELENEIRDGIDQVVHALESAQLKPYFDASIDVMTTAADLVSMVPVDILPDDVKHDLEEAVAPIKQIDFDTAIKHVLEGQLHDILHTLDTTVLDEVAKAYADVLAFLERINPRDAFEELEREAFDPMLERIAAIDPAEVLEPISSVLDELKEAVRSIDLRADVLQPLDDAFGQLRDVFADLNPGEAVQPLVDQVAGLRTAIADTLHLEAWLERLDAVQAFVDRNLDRLDFAQLVALLDSAWDELRPAPGKHEGPSALGTLLSGLLEDVGLPVRADAFTTVAGWLAGADAAAEVRTRLAGAAAAVASAKEAAEHADVQAIASAVQPLHRDLLAAVRSHPEDSALRRRLEPALARSAPADLLGSHVDNRARYLAALDQAHAALQEAAASGRSEVNAIANGLREALRPLQAVPDKFRALFARFGIDVDGRDLREITKGLFDLLEPSRLLAPVTAAFTALRGKVSALVRDGLLGPVRHAITDLQGVIAALDISFLTTELQSIHDELLADIDALRPSALLGPIVDSFEQTQRTILGFDPLGAGRAVVEAMKAAVAEVVNDFRPTTIFGPILDLYDHILEIASGLDVKNLLQPVLTALHDIEAQLDEGLDRTADALDELQAALP